MTTNTAVLAPVADVKPTTPGRYILVAFASGLTSSFVSILPLMLGLGQGASVVIGMIVGTLLAGQLIQAKTAGRWAGAFGLVFAGQLVTGIALMLIAGVASASI